MPTSLQIVKRLYPQVLTVEDSKSPLKITVTKHDCQSRGVKKHTECALAVACKRIADGAIICVKTAYLVRGKRAIRYSVPESASREITSFDRNAPFEPGSYHLAAIPPSSRLGTKRTPGAHTGNGKKPNYHRTENIREILTA